MCTVELKDMYVWLQVFMHVIFVCSENHMRRSQNLLLFRPGDTVHEVHNE